jgi:hypothetical protein
MKFDMYIMAPEPISTEYFVTPCHQSVCLYVYFSYHIWAKAGKNATLLSLLWNSSVKQFL